MITIKLCTKTMKTKDNREFAVYFGYRYDVDKDGNRLETHSDKSFKIKLTKNLEDRLKRDFDNKYPFFMLLDEESKDYFITIDKYKSGKPKLDKDGHKHCIMVISNFRDIQEAPREKLTIDDMF